MTPPSIGGTIRGHETLNRLGARGMWKLWVTIVAVVLVVCGCSTVNTKPVEIEMPGAERHFIVMAPAPQAET